MIVPRKVIEMSACTGTYFLAAHPPSMRIPVPLIIALIFGSKMAVPAWSSVRDGEHEVVSWSSAGAMELLKAAIRERLASSGTTLSGTTALAQCMPRPCSHVR